MVWCPWNRTFFGQKVLCWMGVLDGHCSWFMGIMDEILFVYCIIVVQKILWHKNKRSKMEAKNTGQKNGGKQE